MNPAPATAPFIRTEGEELWRAHLHLLSVRALLAHLPNAIDAEACRSAALEHVDKALSTVRRVRRRQIDTMDGPALLARVRRLDAQGDIG